MVRAGAGHCGARLRRAPRAPGPLIAASKKLANRLLVSSTKHGIFVRALTHGYRAPEHVVSRKKLFGSTLKTSAVFLSGFLSPKRKELGGRT